MPRTDIEPVLPEQHRKVLEDLACTVIERSARLAGKVREPLRSDLAEITRWMHCYYSNLSEGQQPVVSEIEAALRKDFSADPEKRDLQQLAVAHLDVQRWAHTYERSAYSSEFFCELHGRFYDKLPPSLRIAKDAEGKAVPLAPGVLRDRMVKVGAHFPPNPSELRGLLEHFQSRYDDPGQSRVTKIIGIAASHHRLAWIHPFRDGNGRVVRLFSDTLIRRLGVDGGGLWSLSRGLAFKRKEYFARLANADQARMADSPDDGRGVLSERSLREFCEFVLTLMVDQIDFMEGLFELDALEDRLEKYVRLEAGLGSAGERVLHLMREALLRGEVERGAVARAYPGNRA